MRFTRASILLILLAGFVLGAESLRGAWHFDDYYTIVRNDALRQPSSLISAIYDPSLFSADPARPMYRPVLVTSYVLNYLILGEDVRGFLLINLLLHICNALLVWGIARRLMGEGMEIGALAAGLVFAAHPAATEGIAYVSSRSAVLATTFTLGAFLAYIKWDEKGSVFSLLAAALLFILGLGTKAIAVIFPAALLMYHLWYPGEEGVRWKKAAAGVGVMAALVVGYVFLRRLVMVVVLAESLVRPLEENLLTQACAYMHYLRMYLWPLHQSINPYFPTYSELSDPGVMASISALGLLALSGLFLRRFSSRSIRTVSFGLLWLLMAFLPESSIVPLNLVVSERRMILPLVGYSLLAGALVGMVRARWRAAIVVSMAVCLSSLSMARLNHWRTELSVWRAAVRVDPAWGLLWNNIGLIHLEVPDTLRAMRMFELSMRHDPDFKEAYLNMGHLFNQSGRSDMAQRYYMDALTLDEGYTRAAVHLAQTWDRIGREDDARRFLKQYVIKYTAPRAYYLLGVFSEKDGDPGAAARWYRSAVEAGPFDPLPRLALGRLLALAGKREEASEHLRRYLELSRPGDSNRREAIRLLEEISTTY